MMIIFFFKVANSVEYVSQHVERLLHVARAIQLSCKVPSLHFESFDLFTFCLIAKHKMHLKTANLRRNYHLYRVNMALSKKQSRPRVLCMKATWIDFYIWRVTNGDILFAEKNSFHYK